MNETLKRKVDNLNAELSQLMNYWDIGEADLLANLEVKTCKLVEVDVTIYYYQHIKILTMFEGINTFIWRDWKQSEVLAA